MSSRRGPSAQAPPLFCGVYDLSLSEYLHPARRAAFNDINVFIDLLVYMIWPQAKIAGDGRHFYEINAKTYYLL